MKRRIAKVVTVAAAAAAAAFGMAGTATADAAAPAASAAAQSYGPYSDLATCNYWKSGVRGGGTPTTDCYFHRDETTCPGGSCQSPGTGWYFNTL